MNAQRNDNDGKPRRAETGEGPRRPTRRRRLRASEPAPRRSRKGVRPPLVPSPCAALPCSSTVIGASGSSCRSCRPAQTAPAAPPPPTVTVAKPMVRELIEWKEFTGQFEAVDVGRRPGARQRLSRIDQLHRRTDREEGRPLVRHRAEALRARARIGQGRTRRRPTPISISPRPSSQRTSELSKKDYATEETYDERVAQVNTATATRDASQAALDQAQLNLDYTRVTAPIAGRASRTS